MATPEPAGSRVRRLGLLGLGVGMREIVRSARIVAALCWGLAILTAVQTLLFLRDAEHVVAVVIVLEEPEPGEFRPVVAAFGASGWPAVAAAEGSSARYGFAPGSVLTVLMEPRSDQFRLPDGTEIWRYPILLVAMAAFWHLGTIVAWRVAGWSGAASV